VKWKCSPGSRKKERAASANMKRNNLDQLGSEVQIVPKDGLNKPLMTPMGESNETSRKAVEKRVYHTGKLQNDKGARRRNNDNLTMWDFQQNRQKGVQKSRPEQHTETGRRDVNACFRRPER